MRLREIKNLPKVTQLVIKIRATPKYFASLSQVLLWVKHLQFSNSSSTESRKNTFGSFGRWQRRLGRAQCLFAILAFTLLSSHVFSTPPSYHNSLLKYLKTISCLKAPWSLQRDLIQIQISKFHLKWEDPVLGYYASHEAYSS